MGGTAPGVDPIRRRHLAAVDPAFAPRSSATYDTAGSCSHTCAIGEVPNLDEVIACNEAVREPDEVSPSADDDELARVANALTQAQILVDPIDAAAALAYKIAAAQGFYEGNKDPDSSAYDNSRQ